MRLSTINDASSKNEITKYRMWVIKPTSIHTHARYGSRMRKSRGNTTNERREEGEEERNCTYSTH